MSHLSGVNDRTKAVSRLKLTSRGLKEAEDARIQREIMQDLISRYKYRTKVKLRREKKVNDVVDKYRLESIIRGIPEEIGYINDERIEKEHELLLGDLGAAKENDEEAINMQEVEQLNVEPELSAAVEEAWRERKRGRRMSEVVMSPRDGSSTSDRGRKRGVYTNKGLGLLAQFIPKAVDKDHVNTSLIEALLLVGPSPDDIKRIVNQEEYLGLQSPPSEPTKVAPVSLFMTDYNNSGVELDTLPSFCFPVGIPCQATRTKTKRSSSTFAERGSTDLKTSSHLSSLLDTDGEPKFFSFLLSSNASSQYGVCMCVRRTFEFQPTRSLKVTIETEYCISLVTKYPFFSYLFHVLKAFNKMGGFHLDNDELVGIQEAGLPALPRLRNLNDLALKLRHFVVPPPGNYLNLSFSVHHKRHEARFFRNAFRSRDIEVSRTILMWALPVLLKYLSVRDVISTIGYTVTEMRLVVVCSDLTVTSACMLALLHLLRPLRWVCPVIITLPENLLEYLESPVPVAVGLTELPYGFEVSPGMTLVDPVLGQVELHPDDVVHSHELSLPGAISVVAKLKPLAKEIVNQWEKWQKVSSTSIPRSDMVANYEEVDNIGGGGMASWVPGVSLDLLSDTRAGRNFAHSIAAFVNVINGHLENILSLAMKFDEGEGKEDSDDPTSGMSKAQLKRHLAGTGGGYDPEQSFDSDASSLETNTNAPPKRAVMTRSDLNDSDVKFIHHFRDTQMYSHCSEHHGKTEAGSSLSGRISTPFPTESTVTLDGDSGADVDEYDNDLEMKDYDEDLQATGGRQSIDDVEEEDPMILLFVIMLTGTIPSPQPNFINSLVNEAAREDDNRRADDMLGKGERGRRRAARTIFVEGDAVMASLDGVKSDMLEKGEKRRRRAACTTFVENDAVVASLDGVECKPTAINEDIIWCNGRCNGQADTPTCTKICVDIWETRVKLMKHQQYVKNMAQKKFDLAPSVAQSIKQIYKPDLSKTLKRHPQETEKQFKLRLKRRYAADGRKLPLPPTFKKREHALKVMRRHYSRRFSFRRRIEVGKALQVLKRFVAIVKNDGKAVMPINVRMRVKKRSSALLANLRLARRAAEASSFGADGGQSFGARFNETDTNMGMTVLDAHRAFASINSITALDTTTRRAASCGGAAVTTSTPIEGLTELHSFNWALHGSWPASRVPRADEIEGPSDNRKNGEKFVSHFLAKCTRTGSQLNNVEQEEDAPGMGDASFTDMTQQHMRTDSDMSAVMAELAQNMADDDVQQKLGRSMSISQARPFTALGEGAAEQLTPQQQVAILRLYDVLRKGLVIIKHASKGRPHTRYLYCNDDMTLLYWRSERVDNAETVLRVSLGFAGKRDSDRECRLADVRDIVDDLSTVVLQRSIYRGYVEQKSNPRGVYAPGFISLIVLDRTLDFQVGLEEWETFYHAVKILVNLHQNILPNLKGRRRELTR